VRLPSATAHPTRHPETAGGQNFLPLKPLPFCPPAFARFAGEPLIF